MSDIDTIIDTEEDTRPPIKLYALVPMHLGPGKEVGEGDPFITRDKKLADYLIGKSRASKESPKQPEPVSQPPASQGGKGGAQPQKDSA